MIWILSGYTSVGSFETGLELSYLLERLDPLLPPDFVTLGILLARSDVTSGDCDFDSWLPLGPNDWDFFMRER